MMDGPLIFFFLTTWAKVLLKIMNSCISSERDQIRSLPNHNLATLKGLKGSLTSRLINRLDYSPQKAMRAG